MDSIHISLAYKVLIGILTIFGLIQLFQTTNIFARTILSGQIIAILLTLFPMKTIASIGLLLFIFSLILVIIYSLTIRKKAIWQTLIIIPAVFVLVIHLFELQNYSSIGLLRFSMIIPIITYIPILINNRNYKNEIGFITIIVIDAAMELYKQMEQIIIS